MNSNIETNRIPGPETNLVTLEEGISILIVGPPGAGKGTKAQLLAGIYPNGQHLGMSSILRYCEKNNLALLEGEEWKLKKRKLVSDHIVMNCLEYYLEVHSFTNEVLIFDGLPRTAEQAKELIRLLQKQRPGRKIYSIELHIPTTVAIERANQRREECLARGEVPREDDTPELAEQGSKEYFGLRPGVVDILKVRSNFTSFSATGTHNVTFKFVTDKLGVTDHAYELGLFQ